MRRADDVRPDEMILDIGPQSVLALDAYDSQRRHHHLEWPDRCVRVRRVRRRDEANGARDCRSDANGAFSIAGGGDTLAAIAKYDLGERISYISTGGGAFLEYLEGKKLPAIEILEQRAAETRRRYRSEHACLNRIDTRTTMPRSTKIVATLGPASSEALVLERMLVAGVDVVRFNFSHGTAEDHLARAQLVRETAAKLGRDVAIMADLQGPKISVGKFEGGSAYAAGGEKVCSRCERCAWHRRPRRARLQGPAARSEDGRHAAAERRLDRARRRARGGSEIHTLVRIGGELSNNKGINKLGGGLSAPALTGKDVRDIETAMQCGADYVAISFVKSRTDVEMARQLATIAGEKHGIKPQIIAKIERAEAIPMLREILDAADGIMVARGDLAVEVGNAAVPALQKRMIKMAREANKLAITATQMMESMIHNASPTRAEVSDVANAVLDGTDAVMLSAETAAGKYPVEVVETMASIVQEADKLGAGRARSAVRQSDIQSGRSIDCVRGAVHRLPSALRGDLRADRLGLDHVVDEPARHRHSDFRVDAEYLDRAAAGAVSQRASAAFRTAYRSRRIACSCRAPAARQGSGQAGRSDRADSRRTDGAAGWHQCAEDRAGRRAVES